MTRRSFVRSCVKSISWGIVSFFVIFGTEALVIAWRDGWEMLASVASAAALGVAASCVVKIPFHLAHDHGWDHLFHRFDRKGAARPSTPIYTPSGFLDVHATRERLGLVPTCPMSCEGCDSCSPIMRGPVS